MKAKIELFCFIVCKIIDLVWKMKMLKPVMELNLKSPSSTAALDRLRVEPTIYGQDLWADVWVTVNKRVNYLSL